ncbi:tyrosine-type recombinase/integrase [Sphingomonas sp. LY160]|uniref:tyrosine-type recombinase/integrase n=1 Tax=Sphingomonas sp. LY160 TaxID=3095342 RepID=UPI002ADEF8D2|nr:integrase arm-type DNA-binding domain-containing protein [Sphingomonas sp. LY160]MEA1072063.1 integrase arm-type DNA-binding domain-containing protein [Sphingomonas sp. LY160]
MALTDTAIRLAKAEVSDRKLADGKGLYLLVTASGSKLWRLKYRIDGKEKKLALGSYPEVGLKQARARRDAARQSAQAGRDPSNARREARIAGRIAAATTFAGIADEYIAKLEAEGKAAVTIGKTRWLLTKLSPALGTRPIADISPQELLAVLKRVEREGHRETARRLRSFSSRVFRYAVATARASVDPAQPLRGALISPVAKHHAAITDSIAFGKLLRSIDSYSGQPVTKLALRFTPHVYQRPGEVRKAEWREVDFDNALWTIPADRMKQRQPHRVPLSEQALAILREAAEISGGGRYIFPKLGSPLKPMCENAINGALRRMGYGPDEMTAHGFRSTASSLLNESGKWSADAIERALSHADGNQVRAAYHRGAHWPERVEMAQWWSDHLDTLQEGATVFPFPSTSFGISAG